MWDCIFPGFFYFSIRIRPIRLESAPLRNCFIFNHWESKDVNTATIRFSTHFAHPLFFVTFIFWRTLFPWIIYWISPVFHLFSNPFFLNLKFRFRSNWSPAHTLSNNKNGNNFSKKQINPNFSILPQWIWHLFPANYSPSEISNAHYFWVCKSA